MLSEDLFFKKLSFVFRNHACLLLWVSIQDGEEAWEAGPKRRFKKDNCDGLAPRTPNSYPEGKSEKAPGTRTCRLTWAPAQTPQDAAPSGSQKPHRQLRANPSTHRPVAKTRSWRLRSSRSRQPGGNNVAIYHWFQRETTHEQSPAPLSICRRPTLGTPDARKLSV